MRSLLRSASAVDSARTRPGRLLASSLEIVAENQSDNAIAWTLVQKLMYESSEGPILLGLLGLCTLIPVVMFIQTKRAGAAAAGSKGKSAQKSSLLPS